MDGVKNAQSLPSPTQGKNIHRQKKKKKKKKKTPEISYYEGAGKELEIWDVGRKRMSAASASVREGGDGVRPNGLDHRVQNPSSGKGVFFPPNPRPLPTESNENSNPG